MSFGPPLLKPRFECLTPPLLFISTCGVSGRLPISAPNHIAFCEARAALLVETSRRLGPMDEG